MYVLRFLAIFYTSQGRLKIPYLQAVNRQGTCATSLGALREGYLLLWRTAIC